jgi:hypothetical protein
MTMSDGDFRRAFGNQRTTSSERVIPATTWALVQTSTMAAARPDVFTVEVAPDRDWAAIAAGGVASDGKPVVELVDYRPGVGWVAERVAELVARHGGDVVIEARGPAAALNLSARELSTADVVRASGAFFDAVADRTCWVRADDRLDRAVAAAARQPVGDAWRFGRKAGGDVCPLNAAVLAHACASTSSGDAFVGFLDL